MKHISTFIKLQPIIDHILYNNYNFRSTEYIGLNFNPSNFKKLYYNI